MRRLLEALTVTPDLKGDSNEEVQRTNNYNNFRCNGKDYEYTCDGVEEGSDQGVWKVIGEDPGAVDADGKLTDVICNAPDLVLNKAMYEQTGLEIQCVEVGGNEGVIDEAPEEGPTVMSQGNCLLLCDWYPILNFYTR